MNIYKNYKNPDIGIWLRNLIGHIVIIEGPISAGKTTLGQSIEKLFHQYDIKCKFFKEYKNDVLLDYYIKNMKTESFTYQVIMLRERFRIYTDAVRLALNEGYAVFIDRGLVGDLAFALMQISKQFFTEEQKDVYMSLLESENKNIVIPSATVYLQIPPKLAYERLKRRGNVSEVKGYSIEYFEDLEKSYMEANKLVNCKISYLDWTDEKHVNLVNGVERLDESDVINFLKFVYSNFIQ